MDYGGWWECGIGLCAVEIESCCWAKNTDIPAVVELQGRLRVRDWVFGSECAHMPAGGFGMSPQLCAVHVGRYERTAEPGTNHRHGTERRAVGIQSPTPNLQSWFWDESNLTQYYSPNADSISCARPMTGAGNGIVFPHPSLKLHRQIHISSLPISAPTPSPPAPYSSANLSQTISPRFLFPLPHQPYLRPQRPTPPEPQRKEPSNKFYQRTLPNPRLAQNHVPLF